VRDDRETTVDVPENTHQFSRPESRLPGALQQSVRDGRRRIYDLVRDRLDGLSLRLRGGFARVREDERFRKHLPDGPGGGHVRIGVVGRNRDGIGSVPLAQCRLRCRITDLGRDALLAERPHGVLVG
jgi:hypothetical protein